MWSADHRRVTEKAFDLLLDVDRTNSLGFHKATIAIEAGKVDDYRDLEFVDVESIHYSGGRDDPHVDRFWENDDVAHTEYKDKSLTPFNHYIDIKKGRGSFDDYDGYSYARGSASSDQYQTLIDAAKDPGEKLQLVLIATLSLGLTSGIKVDEGINWWFNDEYVHAPGQPWYRGCSPAVERYSFPQDMGMYNTKRAEFQERFPLAESTGREGMGIPYSVFMPVDNMARYWYSRFLSSKKATALGPVMHAIQDASVPHHAAGYNGNWHVRYEGQLNARMRNWMYDAAFEDKVKGLFAQWNRLDPSPPTRLNVGDWTRLPARNWRIDQLVTWVALNAYREYDRTYNHFRNGYSFKRSSAIGLAEIATAMSLLALIKATNPPDPLKEDCLRLAYGKAKVERRHGPWEITIDGDRLYAFGDSERDARQALRIIKHYRMNKRCFVGRPDPSMTYLLVDEQAPTGLCTGEDCLPFDPASIKTKYEGGRWYLVDGGRRLLPFGQKPDEARTALRIIKRYGFNRICFVGRPDPPMIYFRR